MKLPKPIHNIVLNICRLINETKKQVSSTRVEWLKADAIAVVGAKLVKLFEREYVFGVA
jgi:hypothetical protein